jgi:hypothetical protein
MMTKPTRGPDSGAPRRLVHRSRQKIHPSMALHTGVRRFQPYQRAGIVNHMNASVH